ncbi:peptidylprolyl isomerase, partial [Staphylococcus pseudintermedius]|uniref:peptidylprolyl isomerase n=1 Tax=Staphylococcus pseudintermedius TaxID=283734 RepID=UPI001F48BA73
MKKGIQRLFIPITASAVLLGACGNDAPTSKDQTLISSKAGDVKVEDVLKEIGNEQIASQSFKVLLNKILEKKYGDKVDQKQIDKETDEEIEKYGGKKQFESLLKQQGMTIDDYKEQRKLVSYQKELLNEKVKVSDKEIKESTKKASHILIKVKQDKDDKEGLSDKDAKKKIDEIKEKLDKNPKDFHKMESYQRLTEEHEKASRRLDTLKQNLSQLTALFEEKQKEVALIDQVQEWKGLEADLNIEPLEFPEKGIDRYELAKVQVDHLERDIGLRVEKQQQLQNENSQLYVPEKSLYQN